MTRARPMPSYVLPRAPDGARGAEFIARLRAAIDELDLATLGDAARSVHDAWSQGRRVFVLGNGGSAATASHFVCDLHGMARGGPRLQAFSLTENAPLLSAIANDLGYERVFSEQIAANVRAGDVVVVLSASGDSENVVLAIDAARDAGARTIGILGFGGGRARERVDVAIVCSSHHYGVVESVHSAVTHLLTELVRGGETS
jgi:D-sedoheptulose 7-phosphate isomerase